MRKMYTIYDVVSKTCYPQVLLFAGDPPAIRFFHDALSRDGNDLNAHPADYQLLFIGEFLEDGSVLPSYGGVVIVATGSQWLEARAPEGN